MVKSKVILLLNKAFPEIDFPSLTIPNLCTLDDVLSCFDEYSRVDIENAQDKISEIFSRWKEENYYSKQRLVEDFINQIIWLNNLIEKRTYSNNLTSFNLLFNYPIDESTWNYYYILREVNNNGYLIFKYLPSDTDTIVNSSNLLKLTSDFLTIIGLKSFTHKMEIHSSSTKSEPSLKVQALVNLYSGKTIFSLTDKGTLHYNSFRTPSKRTADRVSLRANKAHLTLLITVIDYLTTHSLTNALTKANKELLSFKSNSNL